MVTCSFAACRGSDAFARGFVVLWLSCFFLFFDHNCFYFTLLILSFYVGAILSYFVIFWIPIQIPFLSNLLHHFVKPDQTSIGLMVFKNTDDLEPLLVFVSKWFLTLLTECRYFGNVTCAASLAHIFEFQSHTEIVIPLFAFFFIVTYLIPVKA